MTHDTLLSRLCLMMAFCAVTSQGQNTKAKDSAQNIIGFAKLMNEFCDTHIPQAFPEQTIRFSEDRGATKVDQALNLHLEDLRKNEETHLPEDRETLIQFYDRLQQRKTRRNQWLFYAQATEKELADLILKYLDEEIEERNKGGYQ